MAIFPTSVSTDTDLYIAVNNRSSVLTDNPLTAGATTVNVSSTTGFPTSGIITTDLEAIFYTGKTATSFTGCTRGFDGTTAVSHLIGATVAHDIPAAHHNVLKDEIKAVEQNISDRFGLGSTNVTIANGNLFVYSGKYVVVGSGSPFAALTVNTYRDAGGLTGPVAIDVNGNFGTATAHPVIVETQHELAPGNAVAAYDSQVQIIGTNNTSHMVSFQSRANHASTGTLDILYGFVSQEAIQTGTVTDRYSYYVADASGAGTLVNNYGLYVENLVKGTILRYAIFTAGTTPSYLGGSIGIGISPGVAKLSVKSLGTNTTVLRAVSAADSQELFNVRENASGHGELYLFDSAEVTKVGILSSGISYFLGGETGFGTTTPLSNFKGIDVSSGGITLVLGADNGASTRTTATNKNARVVAPHYTNSEEQTSIYSIGNTSTGNVVMIGGGEASFNAATVVEFYSAANNTTLSGTLGMSLLGTSAVQIFKTSNQLILGTSNTVTLSATAPAASRTWTLPDLSTNPTFAALEAAQTFTGLKSFSDDIKLSSTKKLFFDGGGDTYIIESAANILDHVVGGTTILRATSSDVYTDDYTDYSSTSTVVGFSAFTTKLIYYKKVGKLVTLWWQIEGTSNSTALTFTLPYTAANTLSIITCGFTTDNGTTTTTGGYALILKNTSTAILRKDMAGTTWSNVGTKEAIGQFTYQTT